MADNKKGANMTMKGQTALDFLMTYGWALLLIVLVIGALFALGIFDIGSFLGSRATGFAQVGVAAWRITDTGNFTVQLTNRVGSDIRVDAVSWTYRGVTGSNTTVNTTITNGQTSPTIFLGTVSGVSPGASYSIQMIITYTDLNTNFQYQSSGTITGKFG
jgi:hypothetical protein